MNQKLISNAKSKPVILKLSLNPRMSVLKVLMLSKALPEKVFLSLLANFDQATKIID
jgi:hypothetical protein